MRENEKPKHEKIAEITYQLILKHGYRKVTMSDIAKACSLSRPTVYAAFANKEAVVEFLIEQHIEHCRAESANRLAQAKTLHEKLTVICDVWITEPAASVVDNENGVDLMANISIYVPKIKSVYEDFEKLTLKLLKAETDVRSAASHKDLAKVFALSVQSLKASTKNIAELRRLINVLIAVTTTSSSSDIAAKR